MSQEVHQIISIAISVPKSLSFSHPLNMKKRDCDRCAIPLSIIICFISRIYSAANTNSPVMSLKNTLYVPAGTLILLSTPFLVQVP